MNRCQAQYLHPQRHAWVDCAKPAPISLTVGATEREVCTDHRDQVRRAERAGLAAGLRWSEHPVPATRPPKVLPGQLALVDVPATRRRSR
jgi:hypothetical protein